MLNDTLLYWTPGPIEIIVVLIFGIIPVAGIVMLVRYVLGNRRENIRLRLEVGKLADELEQARRGNEEAGKAQAD